MPRSLKTLFEPVFLTLAALAMSAPAMAESEWQFDNVERLYALADIHGAYDAMVTTLENAGVIDAEGSWIAGESHLVICGDILDRGPDSRPAMDLLMRLEDEALAAGGRVHVLLGNHEAMNLVGDLRYVSRAEYAAFADDETAEDRDRWFEAWAARGSNAEGAPAELRARFDERFPPGFFAHRRAFATDGKYGSWLLDKPLVVVVNRTAFVHGGLSPLIGEIGLEGVNRRLAGDIGRYVEDYETLIDAELLLPTDNFYTHVERLSAFMAGPNTEKTTISAVSRLKEMADSDVHSPEGPMWYRGNAHCSKLIEHDRLAETLAAIGADRVVIGHTPTPGRQVLERFDGQIIEIDTGMLNAYYKGRGHALLLEGESVRVVPEIEGSSSEPIPAPRRVGSRSGGALSAEALEELLASGEISATRDDAAGRTIASVTDGAHTIEALFEKRPSKNFYPGAAAYRLDRMLELDMVPVSVPRSVDGADGVLSYLPSRWMDETARGESGRGGSATCDLNDQWATMYLFDALIYNLGRSLDRMLYSTDIWQLILVDHSDAFGTAKRRPRHLAKVPLDVNPSWRSALETLNEAQLTEELGDVLDERRRKALLARRDALLPDR